MNVGELREVLSKMPADATVVLSSDGEGNSYKTLLAANPNEFHWHEDGEEIRIHSLTKSLEMVGYTEEDVREGGERCVVLWP